MAFLAAVVSTVLGAFLGLAAGFLGGWVDATVSRIMDFLLAFPQLLFSIALVSVLPDSFFGLDGRVSRMAVLIGVIGFFGWPYIGRIVRGQVLSLREREFIEASRSLGARTPRILFRELLPNLAAPILVYTTLIIPTNIITERRSASSVSASSTEPLLGRHALRRQELLPVGPDVHGHSRHVHLHHGSGLQPLRRRAAGRPRPEGALEPLPAPLAAHGRTSRR